MMIDWHHGRWRFFPDDTDASGGGEPLYTCGGDLTIPGPVTLHIAKDPSSHGWLVVPVDVEHFTNALRGQHAYV